MHKDLVIIGIDPGLVNIGIAIACKSFKGTTTITTTAKDPLAKRLQIISDTLETILKTVRSPKESVRIIIEGVFSAPRKHLAEVLQALGVIKTSVSKHFGPTHIISPGPALWLRDLLGTYKKGTHKTQIKTLIESCGWHPNNQHEADAAGLVLWFLKKEDTHEEIITAPDLQNPPVRGHRVRRHRPSTKTRTSSRGVTRSCSGTSKTKRLNGSK